jgi:hypothetical protein
LEYEAKVRIVEERMVDQSGAAAPRVRHLLQRVQQWKPAASARYHWLVRLKGAELLVQLATALEITHHLLDELASEYPVEGVRMLLRDEGQLPPTDRSRALIDGYEARAATIIDGVKDQTARPALETFSKMQAKRLTVRLRKGRLMAGHVSDAIQEVKTGVALVDWLWARDGSFITCRQADINVWVTVAAGPGVPPLSARVGRGRFLRWAIRRRLITASSLPVYKPPQATPPLDRAPLIRRLLEATAPPAVVFAGLLVLVYGFTLRSLVLLTRGELVDLGDDEVWLRAPGRDPIGLPPVLAHIGRALIDAGEARQQCLSAAAAKWLFVGALPDQHLSPRALGDQLHALGIYPGRARSACLEAGLKEFGIPITQQLLGFSSTAIGGRMKTANRSQEIVATLLMPTW